MMQYKNKKVMVILSATAVTAALLAGCANERLEDELSYRTIGISSMEEGDYEGAIDAFSSALEQHIGKIGETEIDICYYKAAAQYASGDITGALESYDNLLKYDNKNADAYYMRGCIMLQQGDSEQALSDYEKAVKYNPNEYELYVNIYENLVSHNLTEDGEGYLNKAFAIKGDAAENLAWRGRIYTLLGQYDNAATELSAALEKESVIANLYLAQLYDAQGDSANAQTYYKTYVDSGEADSVAMNALADIEIAQGNYAAALDYVNQGLAMDNVPNKKALMQNQMIACEYTGDFDTAWQVMQEYIALYPEDTTAQREYTFLKNRQEATEVTEEETVPEETGTEQVPVEGTEATENTQ